jgi:hypothetical protein
MTEPGGPGRDVARPQATDFSRPAIARVYDYLLGGKDHMPADRRVGDRLISAGPAVLRARENRKFLERAVRFLAAEAGIRQFLDIGVGYPVPDGNVHEIAQAIAPQSRVAYVDNDPVVVIHARALMTSTAEGKVSCARWDLRYDDPGELLADPAIRDSLDFGEPVALLIVGVLHFVLDEDEPAKAIEALVGPLTPGSHVAASHVAMEHDPVGAINLVAAYDEGGIPVQLRDSGEFRRLAFPGLEMVPPGVVPVSQWRPAFGTPLSAAEVCCYGGVARKR